MTVVVITMVFTIAIWYDAHKPTKKQDVEMVQFVSEYSSTDYQVQ
jgi:hypothetical protein